MAVNEGYLSGNLQEVDASHNALVKSPGKSATGVDVGGGNANAPALFSEVDGGSVIGTRVVKALSADTEGRLRIAPDVILDDETFNYGAQNTGKYRYDTSTMTITWSTAGLLTNAINSVGNTNGVAFGSWAFFPILGGSNSLICSSVFSLSNNVTANSIIDIGVMLKATSTPFAPTDGIYFRINSSGIFGVVNNNGTETTSSVFTFTPTINQKYKYQIRIQQRQVYFFIDDILYGTIITPAGNGQPCMSDALPYGLRQVNSGVPGANIQLNLTDYTILLGGSSVARSLGEVGNSAFGSYQGLSGGTMGGLTVYTNSTNPTAAVPTNTALTANLPAGLGGQAWETFTLAVNTDGILMSYQVPAGTVSQPGKRLKVAGVKMSAYVQTVLAGGPLNSTFALAFGHTAVSLATAEAATTKKPRIVLLPELTQTVTATQAVSTAISQPGGCVSLFPEPIYVNPGEFIAFVIKHIGTVGSSGTIAYNIQYIYSWE